MQVSYNWKTQSYELTKGSVVLYSGLKEDCYLVWDEISQEWN